MNQQIQTALVNVSSFVELAILVKNAKENVSFFGHRYIYIDGYEGTLSIDALALRVMTLVRQNINFNQDDQDILNGQIIPQISKIYQQNDNRWKNPLTFTMRGIRDQWNYLTKNELTGKDPRFFWEEDYCEDGFDFTEHPGPLPRWLRPQVTREQIQPILANIPSFTRLLPIVENARENISFLGCRYIYIEGYEGTLPINGLASRVMELARNTINFTQEENYREIVPLIDELYLQNDRRKKNPFTQTLCYTRDIWSCYIKKDAKGSRSQWEQHKNDNPGIFLTINV